MNSNDLPITYIKQCSINYYISIDLLFSLLFIIDIRSCTCSVLYRQSANNRIKEINKIDKTYPRENGKNFLVRSRHVSTLVC